MSVHHPLLYTHYLHLDRRSRRRRWRGRHLIWLPGEEWRQIIIITVTRSRSPVNEAITRTRNHVTWLGRVLQHSTKTGTLLRQLVFNQSMSELNGLHTTICLSRATWMVAQVEAQEATQETVTVMALMMWWRSWSWHSRFDKFFARRHQIHIISCTISGDSIWECDKHLNCHTPKPWHSLQGLKDWDTRWQPQRTLRLSRGWNWLVKAPPPSFEDWRGCSWDCLVLAATSIRLYYHLKGVIVVMAQPPFMACPPTFTQPLVQYSNQFRIFRGAGGGWATAIKVNGRVKSVVEYILVANRCP